MRCFLTLMVVLCLVLAGCTTRGILYTREVQPFTDEFHATPVGSKVCRVQEHQLKEPFSRMKVSVDFTTGVIQEAAHRAGITNICYADVATYRILNGVYQRKTLIIYGD